MIDSRRRGTHNGNINLKNTSTQQGTLWRQHKGGDLLLFILLCSNHKRGERHQWDTPHNYGGTI